jgi:hypothetical protein
MKKRISNGKFAKRECFAPIDNLSESISKVDMKGVKMRVIYSLIEFFKLKIQNGQMSLITYSDVP